MRYALLFLVSLLTIIGCLRAQTYQTYPAPRQPYQQPQGSYQNPGYQQNPYGWNSGSYNQYPQQNPYNQQPKTYTQPGYSPNPSYQPANTWQPAYPSSPSYTYPPGAVWEPNPYAMPRRRVQLALILDTSGSMEGLIGQAKAKLWSILNELSYAFTEPGTVPPLVEISLYEYGSSRYYENGHVRQLVPFTLNLDLASEMLYNLFTTGSQEFAGLAVQQAAYQLAWSNNPDDIKMIFIAGNESFYQGPVDYRAAMNAAIQRGITVHTIYCGNHQQGIREGWAEAANQGYGAYSSINHNSQVRVQPTYYETQIVVMNDEWNATYIPYGNEGATCYRRQSSQDQNASRMGQGILAERLEAKAGGSYYNPDWDLVDAVAAGKVNLAMIPVDQLPQEMRAMTPQQRTAYVEQKRQAREQLRTKIRTIAQSERAAAPAAAAPSAAAPSAAAPSAAAQPAQPAQASQPGATTSTSPSPAATPAATPQPGRTPAQPAPVRPGETPVRPTLAPAGPGAVATSPQAPAPTRAETPAAAPAESIEAGTLDRAVIESARRARAMQENARAMPTPNGGGRTQVAPR